MNQVDGAIVALDIYSPRSAVKEHWRSIGGAASPDDLPKLQYGSDLMWGKWVEGNSDVTKLRVYAVHNIINDETTALVSRAMRNKLVKDLQVWPGTVFDKDKDAVEFQALIGKINPFPFPFSTLLYTLSNKKPTGSPIGGTIAIMLAQHK